MFQRIAKPFRISIHALLAESDLAGPSGPAFLFNFYPRSPCGERPGYQRLCGHPTTDFYPRSPCGERRLELFLYYQDNRFLSTLSLRRATPAEHHANSQQEFLSTLSLRRATSSMEDLEPSTTHFYPRSPCGERHVARMVSQRPLHHFYPRSPCGERLIS